MGNKDPADPADPRPQDPEDPFRIPSDVVLPRAPPDEFVGLYLDSGRLLLCTGGVFSFTALTVGMVFFVMATASWWFSVFITVFTGYLFLSYVGVSIWGRDFDAPRHRAMVTEHAEFCPRVDVFLPVCGEPLGVLNNTWEHVAKLHHPCMDVHVLDDGASPAVESLAAAYGFRYIVRPDRPTLKKAGNLRHAFSVTTAPIFVIFDADFCPRRDFLCETLPYFDNDERIAIVQTPQFFEVRPEQTWVEKAGGVVQELFYRFVQVNRDDAGGAVCVGTCGVYRREALAPFGGTAAIGYSEDVHTGFSIMKSGWKLRYVPLVLSMGICPTELRAFFTQQYRWSAGSTTLMLNREFWTSSLTVRQKMCYFTGMLYYQATALSIFVTPLPGIIMLVVKPEGVAYFNIAFAIPSIVFSMALMPLWCKQHYPFSTNQAKVVQNFAHLFAIFDKLCGNLAAWVPTGGGGTSSGAAGRRFTYARWLCALWTFANTGASIGLTTWRITQGLVWWNFVPGLVLVGLQWVLNCRLVLNR